MTKSDRRIRDLLKTSWIRHVTGPKWFSATAIIGFYLILCLFPSFFSSHDPYAIVGDPIEPPSSDHIMGTDLIGRDIFSRLVWGTRVSMMFAVGVAGLSFAIGMLVGSVPAYYGGTLDHVLSRFTEFFIVIPRLVLAILMVAIFGNSITIAMVVVGATLWPSTAKLIRSQILSVRNRVYVQAAIASGGSGIYVLFNHVVPNAVQPAIAFSVMQMGDAMLTEATLSFLGLGDPNNVSWGQLLYKAQNHISAWWMSLFPGVAILSLVLAFNILGDCLNIALSPQLRELGMRVFRQSHVDDHKE